MVFFGSVESLHFSSPPLLFFLSKIWFINIHSDLCTGKEKKILKSYFAASFFFPFFHEELQNNLDGKVRLTETNLFQEFPCNPCKQKLRQETKDPS